MRESHNFCQFERQRRCRLVYVVFLTILVRQDLDHVGGSKPNLRPASTVEAEWRPNVSEHSRLLHERKGGLCIPTVLDQLVRQDPHVSEQVVQRKTLDDLGRLAELVFDRETFGDLIDQLVDLFLVFFTDDQLPSASNSWAIPDNPSASTRAD